MTVESGSRTRSAGGAFRRSPGGAFTRLSKYYLMNEERAVEINMSDVASWQNSEHSGDVFNNNGDISIPVYNYDTGAFEFTLNKKRLCTPHVEIISTFTGVSAGYYSSAPTSCPTLEYPEKYVTEPESYMVATQHQKWIDIVPPDTYNYYLYGQYCRIFLYTGHYSTVGGDDSVYGLHETLSKDFYGIDDEEENYILVAGRYFYPAYLVMNIDVDIDSWANGKFEDYVNPNYPTPPYNIFYRENRDFTDFSYYNTNGFGSTTGTYLDCFQQNTKVRIM